MLVYGANFRSHSPHKVVTFARQQQIVLQRFFSFWWKKWKNSLMDFPHNKIDFHPVDLARISDENYLFASYGAGNFYGPTDALK